MNDEWPIGHSLVYSNEMAYQTRLVCQCNELLFLGYVENVSSKEL